MNNQMAIKISEKILYFKRSAAYDDLIRYLEDMIEITSGEFQTRLISELGTSHLIQHDIPKAFAQFEKVLLHSPENIPALYNMGNVHLYCRNYKAAIEYYKKVTDLSPEHEGAYYNMALAYNFTLELDNAIEILERLSSKNSQYYGCYYSLGEMYHQKEDFLKAEQCHQKAISINSKIYDSPRALSLIYAKTAQWKEITTLLEPYLELSEDFTILKTVSDAWWNLGEWDKAAEHYYKMLLVDEDGRVHILKKVKECLDGKNMPAIQALNSFFPEYFMEGRDG